MPQTRWDDRGCVAGIHLRPCSSPRGRPCAKENYRRFVKKALVDHISGPWVPRLGGAVLDVVSGAGELESVGPEELAIGDCLPDQRDSRAPAPGVVNWMPLSVSTVWIL